MSLIKTEQWTDDKIWNYRENDMETMVGIAYK